MAITHPFVSGIADEANTALVRPTNWNANHTIDNDTITYAQIQNITVTDRILGRSTAGAGDIQEIVCTSAGRALIDDADATAQRNTLVLGTADAVTFKTLSAVEAGASAVIIIDGLNPFVRFREGGVNKAYVQWNASPGFVDFFSFGSFNFTGTAVGMNVTGVSDSPLRIEADSITIKEVSKTATSWIYNRIINGTGDLYYGLEGATGGTVFSGTTAYGAFFVNQAARDVQFGTNNIINITLQSGGKFGIGTSSPGAQLHTKAGAAATIGEIIQGAASQTGNLTEWQNSAATILSKIDKDGYLTLPGALRFLGFVSSAAAPTTTELPTNKDLAIHKDTVLGTVRLSFNDGGVIKSVTLV